MTQHARRVLAIAVLMASSTPYAMPVPFVTLGENVAGTSSEKPSGPVIRSSDPIDATRLSESLADAKRRDEASLTLAPMVAMAAPAAVQAPERVSMAAPQVAPDAPQEISVVVNKTTGAVVSPGSERVFFPHLRPIIREWMAAYAARQSAQAKELQGINVSISPTPATAEPALAASGAVVQTPVADPALGEQLMEMDINLKDGTVAVRDLSPPPSPGIWASIMGWLAPAPAPTRSQTELFAIAINEQANGEQRLSLTPLPAGATLVSEPAATANVPVSPAPVTASPVVETPAIIKSADAQNVASVRATSKKAKRSSARQGRREGTTWVMPTPVMETDAMASMKAPVPTPALAKAPETYTPSAGDAALRAELANAGLKKNAPTLNTPKRAVKLAAEPVPEPVAPMLVASMPEPLPQPAMSVPAMIEQPVTPVTPVVAAAPVVVATKVTAAETPKPVESLPRWSLKGGQPIHTQLLGWARTAGWNLNWRMASSWLVPSDTSFEGRFDEVLERVVTGLYLEGRPVRLTIWEGNQYAEVINADGK